LLESFPFLGFFFSRFCLSLLMKEVCHDFPVSRSAIQPDTRFIAVMIGMDAHGFEREFSRLEVRKRIKSPLTAASRRGSVSESGGNGLRDIASFLEGNPTRLRSNAAVSTDLEGNVNVRFLCSIHLIQRA
jgi:hypothetical protein